MFTCFFLYLYFYCILYIFHPSIMPYMDGDAEQREPGQYIKRKNCRISEQFNAISLQFSEDPEWTFKLLRRV